MITVNTAYEIEDRVYLALDPIDDRPVGMITAVHVRIGLITYGVTWRDTREETVHQAFELVPAEDES